MDTITSLYRSDMRLYRDRPDVLTRGAWHWCPPDAKPIPYFHLFGSFINDTDPRPFEPPLGEVPIKRGPVREQTSPRYLGQNWCGSEEVWTRGSLYSQRGTPTVDEEGIPTCCLSAPEIPGGLDAEADGDSFGTTLFFRLNFGPAFLFFDPGFVGGWLDENLFSSQPLLSPIGFGASSNDWGILFSPTFLPQLVAYEQYAIPVGYRLVAPPGSFTLSVGLWVQFLLRVNIKLAAAVTIVDGVTGAIKQQVVAPAAVTGGLDLTAGPIAYIVTMPHNGYSCEPGDVFIVTIGLEQRRSQNGLTQIIVRWFFNGTERITVDGAPLTDPAPAITGVLPVEDIDVPVPGTILPYAGAIVPPGYLSCDGSSQMRTDYPGLFVAIGILWGAVDDDHFNLPDFRGRDLLGAGQGPGLTDRSLAAVGGEEAHTLLTAELASHSHTVVDPTHKHDFPSAVNVYTDAPFGPGGTPSLALPMTAQPSTDFSPTGISLSPNGSDSAHNNMQPFAVVFWMIKT